MKNNLRAVILAAGIGNRAIPLSNQANKVLTPVKGKPLLWYSINALISSGVRDILIAVGYKKQSIINFVRSYFPNVNIEFVNNERYEKTNNIYSYILAKDFIKGHPYFRMEGDLIYSRSILSRLLKSNDPITVAVSQKKIFDGDEFLIEVDLKKHTILRFGKDIPREKAFGEAKGIEFVSKDASHLVNKVLGSKSIYNYLDKFSESAYQLIINKNKNFVYYQQLKNNNFWDELDTPNDLNNINRIYNKKYVLNK